MSLATYLRAPEQISPALRARIEAAAIELGVTGAHAKPQPEPERLRRTKHASRPGKAKIEGEERSSEIRN